jgi:hypothetical protein
MMKRFAIAVGLAAWLAVPAARQDEKLLRFADSRVVTTWNEIAYEIAFDPNNPTQWFTAVRTFTLMHLAMHDALNAVAPFYDVYAFHDREDPQPLQDPSALRERELRADPIVAAAQAAHDVLLSQIPGQQSRLDQALAEWLSPASDGRLKARGIEIGQRAAAAVLAKRNGDGWDVQGSYEFRAGIGDYQTTPPWKGFVLQPGFAQARPFGLASPDRWRPAPQPAIDSQQYADAFNEVKTYGRIDSMRRTPDQTAYAVWWMEFELGLMNRLARTLVRQRQLPLWQTARLFALLHMSIADGGVATWDAKFHYNHWRPYTAIRRGADDGNPKTEADAQWEALRPAPPFPEYPSGHAMGCGMSFEIFTSTFGDGIAFTMESATAPPGMPTRSFKSFSHADAECSDSRVMLGFHYRYAVDAGRKLGHLVARDIVEHHLRQRRTPAGKHPD